MGRRIAVLVTLLALALSAAACEDGGSSGVYHTPSALEVAAKETSQAQKTLEAMDNDAHATADALASEAQATRQFQEAEERNMQIAAEADRIADEAERRQLELERQREEMEAERRRLEAEAERERLALDAERERLAAESTAIEATAEAIKRQGERERMTQPLKTFAPWVLLVLGVAALVLVGRQLLPIVKARMGTIWRDERGDPPMILISQGRVISLCKPTVFWGSVTQLNAGEVIQPLLTEPEYQDGVTKRAQFVDLHKGGRPRPVIVNQTSRRTLPATASPSGQWRDVTEGQPLPALPTNVPLASILAGQPTARSLALGVTMHEGGRAEIVRADMSRLVHVAVAGSSGWGKSVFLRTLAYQLAQSAEPVDLAFVDLEGVTFAPFAKCGRLLYPVADTEQAALAIFQALTREMDRRRELYQQFPGVDSITAYNMRAGEPLAPVICLVDEATALLQDGSAESAIRTLVLRARKYGLWMVLGGQSWKASVLDTTIRDQLASRVQFKAMSASQSRVLLERSGAEQLDTPGRALAILPGRDLFEMQAPYISHHAITNVLSNGGPQHELPEVAQASGEDIDKMRQVVELHEAGESDTAIARKVFGHGNTYYIEKVRRILQQQRQDNNDNGVMEA